MGDVNVLIRRVPLVIGAVLLIGWVGTTPAAPQQSDLPVRVGASPTSPGSYFEVTTSPCGSQTVTISIPAFGVQRIAGQVDPASPDVSSDLIQVPNVAYGDYAVTVTAEGCTYAAATVRVVAPPEPAPVEVLKTVGTEPGICAATSAIEVPAGTTVYYCYTTIYDHQSGGLQSLVDDKLGLILDGPINPGEQPEKFIVSAVINETTTNTATMTIRWQPPNSPRTFRGTIASATVTVVPAAARPATAQQLVYTG